MSSVLQPRAAAIMQLELHMLHTHHVHSSGGRCSAQFSQMQWLIHVFEKLVAHTPETKRKILSKEMCAKNTNFIGNNTVHC